MRRPIFTLLTLGVLAYLSWRLVTVVDTPSAAAAALLAVELLAWLGLGAFLLRVNPPRRALVSKRVTAAIPGLVVAVLASGRPLAAIERTVASLDGAPVGLFVVDDGRRDETDQPRLIDLTEATGGTVVTAETAGGSAALAALVTHLDPESAVVLVEAGSLLAPDRLGALVAPMRDPSVAAVQGGVGWADSSTLTLHGPSRDGLALFAKREAPAAGAAGIAPLLDDGTGLRVRALATIDLSVRDLGAALSAAGWSTRFVEDLVVFRPRPTSTSGWRRQRTAELAAARHRARVAVFARGIRPAVRLRLLAGAGDIASAFARVGLVALLVTALLTGTIPVPGPLGATLLAAGTLWALAAFATGVSVDPVLRFGDRLRLGWHRLDADVIAVFSHAGSGVFAIRPGRLRGLAWFPVSVAALLAVDVAGIVRGLALIDPGIVPGITTSLARAVIGVASIAVLGLLFDALRVFASRPDARDDLRVAGGMRAQLRIGDGAATDIADLLDLSPIGAGLVCSTPIRPGDPIHLSFELDRSGSPIELDATVARVVAEGGAHRVGVRFGPLDASTRATLVRYVATAVPRSRGSEVLPRASTVPVPRGLLRFATVVALIVASTSVWVAPAGAASFGSGTIGGTVAGPTGPAADICVSALNDAYQWSWVGRTDLSGSYSGQIPADTYRVQFQDCSGNVPRLATAWWSSAGNVDQDHAERITLGENDTRSGIDATLETGGWFTGSVQDTSGTPIDGICVNPVSTPGNLWDGGTVTPSPGLPSGGFVTNGVAAGNYNLHFNDCSSRPDPFATAWLGADGVSLVPSQQDAKVFALTDAAFDVGGITLQHGTRITGTVRDDAGNAAGGVCVWVDGPNWQWVGGANTQPDGTYATDPVLPGSWVLGFGDCNPTRTLVNTMWTGTDAIVNQIERATPIVVDGATPTVGPYDQTMVRGGTLTGTLRTDSGPVAGACLNAVDTDGDSRDWQWMAGTQTDSGGAFSLGPVFGDHVTIEANPCNTSTPFLQGAYAGPGQLLVRDANQAVTLPVAANAQITGLDLRAELGATLSGRITGTGAPLADACVTAIDPTTGDAETETTGDDGTWSVVVPSGSYLVQAVDCSPSRGYAGRFSVDAADASGATPVVGVSGETRPGLDIDLPAATPGSIRGRITNGSGVPVQACVVVLTPNSEPIGIVPTEPDGSFDAGSVNPGSYVVGIAGCDFSNDIPPGPTDPTDPSVVYPLQWSTGRHLDVSNIWQDPQWVVVGSASPTDLGTICLDPCVTPPASTTTTTTTVPPGSSTTTPPATTPPTTTPTVVALTPTTPTSPSGSTTSVFVNVVPTPTASYFPDSTADTSATVAAARAISPAATEAASENGGSGRTEGTTDGPDRALRAAAAVSDPARSSSGGSSSWWWLFGLAALLGLGAAGIPWYRARHAG